MDQVGPVSIDDDAEQIGGGERQPRPRAAAGVAVAGQAGRCFISFALSGWRCPQDAAHQLLWPTDGSGSAGSSGTTVGAIDAAPKG
jgi:hypothetical protein